MEGRIEHERLCGAWTRAPAPLLHLHHTQLLCVSEIMNPRTGGVRSERVRTAPRCPLLLIQSRPRGRNSFAPRAVEWRFYRQELPLLRSGSAPARGEPPGQGISNEDWIMGRRSCHFQFVNAVTDSRPLYGALPDAAHVKPHGAVEGGALVRYRNAPGGVAGRSQMGNVG